MFCAERADRLPQGVFPILTAFEELNSIVLDVVDAVLLLKLDAWIVTIKIDN